MQFVRSMMNNISRVAVLAVDIFGRLLQVGLVSVIANMAGRILDVMRKDFTTKVTAVLIT